jgi:hypothetical protein
MLYSFLVSSGETHTCLTDLEEFSITFKWGKTLIMYGKMNKTQEVIIISYTFYSTYYNQTLPTLTGSDSGYLDLPPNVYVKNVVKFIFMPFTA